MEHSEVSYCIKLDERPVFAALIAVMEGTNWFVRELFAHAFA
jgi:hypothetical protein